jgi:hypothetical protein
MPTVTAPMALPVAGSLIVKLTCATFFASTLSTKDRVRPDLEGLPVLGFVALIVVLCQVGLGHVQASVIEDENLVDHTVSERLVSTALDAACADKEHSRLRSHKRSQLAFRGTIG